MPAELTFRASDFTRCVTMQLVARLSYVGRAAVSNLGDQPAAPDPGTNSVPERSDTDGIVAEEARRLVQSLNLPVDLIAHRDGMPRRRPASSCDT